MQPHEKLPPNFSPGPGIYRPRNPAHTAFWEFFAGFVGPTEVRGRNNLQEAVRLWKKGVPIILTANHISNIDALKIDEQLHRLEPEFADRLFYVKGNRLKREPLAEEVSHSFNTLEIIPKDGLSSNRKELVEQLHHNRRAIEIARRRQEEGVDGRRNPCFVFLEGGRSRDGALRKADPNIVDAFFLPGAVVLPIVLQGTDIALPIGKKMPKWRTPISIEFDTIIYTNEIRDQVEPSKRSLAIVTEVMNAIARKLPEDRRGEYA